MGLDANGTKFLLYAKKMGVSFARTAMIGRQTFYLEAEKLAENLNKFDYQTSDEQAQQILTQDNGYAENFFRLLGAQNLDSFDASGYENASHVHDFNQPINDCFKNKYTAVLDGGTLEHIFNFPVAIKNCLEMIAEGGHFLGITPTNNFLAHGFYQFSPELFFRIFSSSNGFKLEQAIIFEDFADSDWFAVTDPATARERVVLCNDKPAYLSIIARKINTVPIFAQTPQQSDYQAIWQDAAQSGAYAPVSSKKKFDNAIGQALRKPIHALRQFKYRFQQTRGRLNQRPGHFKKIDFSKLDSE